MACLVFAGLVACGYRALYAVPAGEKLHVVLVRVAISSGAAGEEVAAGAREELARQGALAAGDGYPRLEIEVTGAAETSEGIEVPLAGRDPHARTMDQTPVARGTNVSIVARGRVVAARGAEPARDTGDVRAEDLVTATGTDPVVADVAYEDAQRATARRLGRKLAARAIGDPGASEAPGR